MMRCHTVKHNLYRMLDGKPSGHLKTETDSHLHTCSDCQSFLRRIQGLNQLIRQGRPSVEPSFDFEKRFWEKISGREKYPWPMRLWEKLGVTIPLPSLSEAVVMVLVAFLIGGTGGALSTLTSVSSPLSPQVFPIRSLSGFSEYKGVPQNTLAGTYLKIADERIQENT